jgi:hypothetical protein
VLFYLSHLFTIFSENQIDCSPFAAKASPAANSVYLILMVARQVIVDYQVALLHIDTTCEQVSGDQNAGHTLPERLHDHRAVVHLQVGVDHAHLLAVLAHGLGQQLGTLLGVHLDDAQADVYFFE